MALKARGVIKRFGWTITSIRCFIESETEGQTRRLYVPDPMSIPVHASNVGGIEKVILQDLVVAAGRRSKLTGTGDVVPANACLEDIATGVKKMNAAKVAVTCFDSHEQDAECEQWVLKLTGNHFSTMEEAKNARCLGNLVKVRKTAEVAAAFQNAPEVEDHVTY